MKIKKLGNEDFFIHAIKTGLFTTYKGIKSSEFQGLSQIKFVDDVVHELFCGRHPLYSILVHISNKLKDSDITMIDKLGFDIYRTAASKHLYYISIKDNDDVL